MNKLLFVFGTRPEAIKLAPIIREFALDRDQFDTRVCVSAQHREMLDQVLDFFDIKPDYDLNIMKQNQTLFDITARIMTGLKEVVDEVSPDVVFVQGDTTTAFIGALSSFYARKRVAHVEAGLRSYNKYSPFPEEINRVLVGHIADMHFAPTPKARENLLNENINENVWIVGNSVIDALFLGLDIIKQKGDKEYYNFFNFVDFSKRVILVTGHRRESFGSPFENICYALKDIADSFGDIEIVYPVHLNPNVQSPVKKILAGHPRIHLIEPLSYPYLIWLMNKSYIVLTDSGGIQEEAPSLGKPVLVMRDVTERTEGIEAGTAKLVGTNRENIVSAANRLLTDKIEYEKMAKAVNPYGDGDTSKRIFDIISEYI